MGGYPFGAEYNCNAPYNIDDCDEDEELLEDWYRSEAEEMRYERHRCLD